MARKTFVERVGVFLAVVLLLVVGVHLALAGSENLRFKHPGRALQATQATHDDAEVKKDAAWAHQSGKAVNRSRLIEEPQFAHSNLEAVAVEDHAALHVEDMDETILMEMDTKASDGGCHCPSVLNGWHAPAEPECLKNCSSIAFHKKSSRGPVVQLKDGPLFFSDEKHDEF